MAFYPRLSCRAARFAEGICIRGFSGILRSVGERIEAMHMRNCNGSRDRLLRSIFSRQRMDRVRGVGRLTALVFCLIVFVVGFVGYNVVPFYYYYFELTNQLHALVAIGDRTNDATLRKRVMEIIKELEVPAEERDIQIDRRDGSLTITVPYSEVFYVTLSGKDYDLHRFSFRASAQGAL